MVDSKLFVVYGGFWQVISFQLCKAQRNERKKQKQDQKRWSICKDAPLTIKKHGYFSTVQSHKTRNRNINLQYIQHPCWSEVMPGHLLPCWLGNVVGIPGWLDHHPEHLHFHGAKGFGKYGDTQDLLESSFPAKSKFTPTQRKAKHWNSTVSGMHLGISLPTSSVPCHRSTCPIWTLAAHLVESGQMTLSCGVMSILPVTLMGLSSTMTLGHKADPTGSRGWMKFRG